MEYYIDDSIFIFRMFLLG